MKILLQLCTRIFFKVEPSNIRYIYETHVCKVIVISIIPITNYLSFIVVIYKYIQIITCIYMYINKTCFKVNTKLKGCIFSKAEVSVTSFAEEVYNHQTRSRILHKTAGCKSPLR